MRLEGRVRSRSWQSESTIQRKRLLTEQKTRKTTGRNRKKDCEVNVTRVSPYSLFIAASEAARVSKCRCSSIRARAVENRPAWSHPDVIHLNIRTRSGMAPLQIQ